MTLEEVKNYKSLQSYRYFTAGWVIEHKWKMFSDCCLVSQTLESATHLPLALQSLFDPVHLEHNYVELIEAGENLHGILDVTHLFNNHIWRSSRMAKQDQGYG